MAQVTRTIEQEFVEEFDGSRQRAMQALEIYPSGIAHDVRYVKPFPVYIARAQDQKKWDVDGHEIIDYSMGHGSLIAGHNNPDVVAAVQAQLLKGTHYGACHDLELEWGDWVQKLIPSAGRVKFTSSGTESTMLAMRVARAFTGREKILKFSGHFHGWNDYAIPGEKPPFDKGSSPGIPQETFNSVVVAPVNDLDFVAERLAQGDVAGVILEPSGASYATIPIEDGFLKRLREITEQHNTVLIFDEVITGFRWAPGGAQERSGVTPDMTTLAKIVAGGLPGGAVAGKVEIMNMFEFRDEPGWNANKRVSHPGTYNANPLAAAAGSACLNIVSDHKVQQHCDEMTSRLRAGMNAALVDRGVPGFVYGEASVFHIMLGVTCDNMTSGDLHTPVGVSPEVLKTGSSQRVEGILTAGMLLGGAHLFHAGGLLSIKHTGEDIDKTIEAFDTTITRMRDEGVFNS